MRELLQIIHDEADHIINTDETSRKMREVIAKQNAKEIKELALKAMIRIEEIRDFVVKAIDDDMDDQCAANAYAVQAAQAAPELIQALILGLSIADDGGTFSDLGRNRGEEFKHKAKQALLKAGVKFH